MIAGSPESINANRILDNSWPQKPLFRLLMSRAIFEILDSFDCSLPHSTTYAQVIFTQQHAIVSQLQTFLFIGNTAPDMTDDLTTRAWNRHWLLPSATPAFLISCPSRIAGMRGKLKMKINQVYHSGNVVEVVLGITLIRLRKENYLFHSDHFNGHGPGQRFVSRHSFVYRRTNAQTESKVLSWKRVYFWLQNPFMPHYASIFN